MTMEKFSVTADLFIAVRKGDISQTKASITPDNINQQDENGSSLLHIALAFRQDEIALHLISAGIDLNAQSKDGKTALSYAAIYQNEPVSQKLIESGADPDLADKSGNGPLWHALQSSRKNYDLFAYLLSKGADPTQKNNFGKSVLDAANARGDENLLSIVKKIGH
jgi:ankyrin repeat protein